MSPSRRSSVSSITSEETEVFNQICQKVKKYGPLTLQSLAGHLSSLPPSFHHVSSCVELKKFLRNYPNEFEFDKTGKINLPGQSKVPQMYSGASNDKFVVNGRGEITRIFHTYGFLKSPHGSVFFNSSSFIGMNIKFLHDLNLKPGQVLAFEAKKSLSKDSAELQATRVWFVESDPNDESNENWRDRTYHSKKKQNKNISEVNQSKNKSTYKNMHKKLRNFDDHQRDEKYQIGRIQNIFQKYGFIEKAKTKQRIFFHLNTIQNCGEFTNLLDLHDILKINDPVEFTCTKSSKMPDRWEAIEVWLKSAKTTKVEDEEDEEGLYLSSTEELTHSIQPEYDENSIDIVDCEGKIFPVSATRADIKFGKSDRFVATAESDIMYYKGKPVEDLKWQFSEGDLVYFDANKIEGESTWRALLVWVGKKPEEFYETYGKDKVNSATESTGDEDEDEGATASSFNKNGKFTLKSEYACWGDSPFMEELDEQESNDKVAEDLPEKKNDYDSPHEEVHHSLVSDSDHGARNIIYDEGEISDEDNMEDDNEEGFFAPEDDDLPPVSDDENNLSQPGVYMFEKLRGEVIKLYRYIVQIKSPHLRKPVSVLLSDLYKDGVCLKEECIDSRDVLKEADQFYFNCFEIIDDEGSLWQKVTVAWCGKKPSIPDMEPREFIALQDLKLEHCVIPTWKSFRKSLIGTERKKEPSSTAPQNENASQNISSSDAKPSSSYCDNEKSQNDVNSMYEHLQQLEDEYDVVPDSLAKQFSQIRRSLNELRRNITDPGSLQDFENLSMDIDCAARSCISLLQKKTSHSTDVKTTSVSCQTNDVSNNLSDVQLPVASSSSSSRQPISHMTTTAVQTFVTGEVTATKIFPS